MNTAEIMDRAIEVYKRSFWRQLVFAAIVALIGAGASAVASVFFTVATLPLVLRVNTSFVGMLILGMFIFMPVFLLWQGFASAGHVMLSKNAFFGEKVRVQHYKLPIVALKTFGALFAQLILVVPVIIVAYLIIRVCSHYLIAM